MQGYKAFTLIELLVVICLCALIANIALVHLSFLDEIIAHTEIDKLMTACLYMQQLAIATNEEQYLIFDEYKHTYRFGAYHEKLPKQVCFGVLSGVKGPPGSPVSLIEKAITFPAKRICFYPTGIVSSGTVYCVSKKRHILYALSNAVSQVSYLRWYRYEKGTWKLYGNDKK